MSADRNHHIAGIARRSRHTVAFVLVGCIAFAISSAQGKCVGAHEHERFHEHDGHRAPTYEVTASANLEENAKRLIVRVLDGDTGDLTAARLSFMVDDAPFVPDAVSKGGIRFVSIHTAKRQQAITVMARGESHVEIELPANASHATVTATKGYVYMPATVSSEIDDVATTMTLTLTRISAIADAGWHATDEHLHYERLDAKHDADWLDMLKADNLANAHFMVLKGGNLPGVWAQQYAYGEEGRGSDGQRMLIPGEEVRDRRQGHINLLGIGELIEPISTGGLGQPPHPYNFPTLFDVFMQARQSGGIGGPAHGGALAGSSTAAVDTILGAAEFFEIANTHLYKIDVWYRLMNCGFIVPPAAGTDLPNFPFRDPWQPFFGETRMYVQTGNARDWQSWKQAVREGKVFVSSGPLISLDVNGVGPGGTIQLPAEGGAIRIRAELVSSQPISALEIVKHGQPIAFETFDTRDGSVYKSIIEQTIEIDKSCWLAARGTGVEKEELLRQADIHQNSMAHTAAIRVIVGEEPITSAGDAALLKDELTKHQEFYRTEGRFENTSDRERMLALFDRAIEKLESAQ